MVKGEQRHLGFTGTRNKLSLPQFTSLRVMLQYYRARGFDYLHHGDCVEADEAAYEVWKSLKGLTHCHPPEDWTYRARTPHNDIMSPEKPFRERNKDIVNPSSVLIGCPKEMVEITRSGTWATIRYARGARNGFTPCVIIFPDGSIKVDNM
jgi:hypothetical protein